MRNLKVLSVVAILFVSVFCRAQSDDKATLIIVRTSSLGAAMNFKYFIDDQFVGKMNYGKYFKLEVEPGEHLIWAKAENRSFVQANLEAGKTYILNAIPQMGGFKAGVHLKAVNHPDEKEMAKIQKYISKKKLIAYDETKKKLEQQDYAGFIEKSLNYYEEKVKGSKNSEMLNEPVVI